jgi:hypothetical protein
MCGGVSVTDFVVTEYGGSSKNFHSLALRQTKEQYKYYTLSNWTDIMPFDGGAFIYTLVWYICSIGSIVSSKQIINNYPLPFTMCIVQFSFAAMCTLGYLYACNLRRKINPENLYLIFIVAVAYAFGYILYNLSMEYGKTVCKIYYCCRGCLFFKLIFIFYFYLLYIYINNYSNCFVFGNGAGNRGNYNADNGKDLPTRTVVCLHVRQCCSHLSWCGYKLQ